MTPTDQRARLAEMVRSQRLALRLTRDAAAVKAQVSPTSWTKVERGQPVRANILWAVDAALGWEPGSADRVLNGGEPSARIFVARAPSPDGTEVYLAQIGETVESIPPDKRAEAVALALQVLRALRQ